MQKVRLSLYFFPLILCTLGIIAGKWIAAQKGIYRAVEALLGKWVNFALGADNPSLVLGALGLILGAALLVWIGSGKRGVERDHSAEGRG